MASAVASPPPAAGHLSGARGAVRRRAAWIGAGVLLALGAVNFLWQLGSSSLYVDEVQSVLVATTPLSHLLHAVATLQITPPGYFLALHEWILRAGSPHAEWVFRLPSALAGVALVAAVLWLARLVLAPRRLPILLAGALCALSPFVLEHAQRAQGYVFVALGATVAVAAALEAEQRERRQGWLLCLSLLGALAALLVHYVAALAVVPLCVWVLTRRQWQRRWRLGYVSACVACGAALIPLVVDQHRYFPHRQGALDSAALTWRTTEAMVGLPFDGRVEPLLLVGAVIGLATLAVVLWRWRRWDSRLRLVAALAISAPVALALLSAVGGSAFWGHVMLTRYAAAAAPFVVVAIAAAAAHLPRPAGLALIAGALAVALTGSIASHRRSGFFLDARRAVAYIRSGHRSGDAVLAPAAPAAAVPLLYYGLGGLQPQWLEPSDAEAALRRRHGRAWLIWLAPSSSAATLRAGAQVLRTYGYRVLRSQVFPGTTTVAVLLAVPVSVSRKGSP